MLLVVTVVQGDRKMIYRCRGLNAMSAIMKCIRRDW